MGSTLVITNDFPPRQGGIETFVHAMATRIPDDDVVIYTSREPGDAAYDAALPFPVVRDTSGMLLPTKRVTRRAIEIARAHDCDRVWFGEAAPLALMAPALRRSGIRRMVATTHGHEIWWARTPGARRMMRRIGAGVDVVTYLGQYTRARIEPSLGPRARMSRLVPGVDAQVYRRDADAGSALRAELGLQGKRVILCVARLVPRKGQDMLIRALPLIRREVPDAVLVVVGRGPDEARLRKLALRHGEGRSASWAGSRTPRPRRTTRRRTSSRCRAAPGRRDWRRRASGSCSWRRRRAVCRWWSATRAVPRTRCSTAGPAASSTAPTPRRSPVR